MADLKPIGSEKLTGDAKLRRIMEIARFNEVDRTTIKETSTTEYSRQLADGKTYHIINEKNGYIIKSSIDESTGDYMEPMKNRKYYSSYSQALKSFNLLAKELNRVHENEEGVSLFGEEKKFVLKTPKSEAPAAEPTFDLPPAPAETEAPATPAAPVAPADAEAPATDELDLDLSLDEPAVDGGSEEMDLGLDMETEPTTDGDEEVSFKAIQKLTGKITQKLRTLEEQQGLTSENMKYVINSIFSAMDLSKLTEEDYDDILNKLEGDEDTIDYGVDDEIDLDIDSNSEMTEPTPAEEPEMAEGDIGYDKIMDEIFSESKVDKILSKYFVITESEKKIEEDKKVNNYISKIRNKVTIKSQIKELSETIEQELTSDFLVKEHKDIKFLGKTNKGNLVFENEGQQLKITRKGEIL
jgi:cell division protein ZapA (FtsZ GTPase activity inhibitor)